MQAMGKLKDWWRRSRRWPSPHHPARGGLGCLLDCLHQYFSCSIWMVAILGINGLKDAIGSCSSTVCYHCWCQSYCRFLCFLFSFPLHCSVMYPIQWFQLVAINRMSHGPRNGPSPLLTGGVGWTPTAATRLYACCSWWNGSSPTWLPHKLLNSFLAMEIYMYSRLRRGLWVHQHL